MSDFSHIMPVVEQDPLAADFAQDPFDFYHALRALGPFVFWKDYDLPVATTHQAVTQVLRHPKLGRQVPRALQKPVPPELRAFYAIEERSLLELEAPDHTRLRRVAAGAFGGAPIALIAPIVSQWADKLIDAFPDGPFDLIEHFAKPLAALTITEFLGVAPENAEKLQTWSADMVAMYQARRDHEVEARAEQAAAAFSTFIRGELAERRASHRPDFLSTLARQNAEGGLSEAEMVSTAILLLNAGHEATAYSVGNAVNLLAEFSGRDDALHPNSIAGTCEECLRYRPPLHLFTRYVYEPVNIEGIAFPELAQIGCLLASASQDDAVWPDGDQFDPFRLRRPHVAFGVGIHACIGASLARLELQVALPALFSRCPKLKIVAPPVVANRYHFYGYEALMVAVK